MYSPKSYLVLLIVLALGALAAQWFGTPEAPRERPRSATGAIVGAARVVDGDSLVVAGDRIRLFGIDAPEGRQECRNAAGQNYACGREAARALTSFIAGRDVLCKPVDHDQHDRDVATCSVQGRDLGEFMVRGGHALDYRRHSKGRYASAEQEARAAKRGLWAGEFERPSEWRKGNPR